MADHPFNEAAVMRFKIAKLVIASLGSLLNITVIIFILARKMYHKSYEIAYLNMAVSDLLFALILTTLVCPREYTRLPDNVICRITPVLEHYMSYVNLLCILPITVDRVTAVVFPIRYSSTAHKKTLLCVNLLCWLLPLLWAGGFSLYLHLTVNNVITYHNLTADCHYVQCDPPESCVPFYFSLDVITMILPLVFNIASYTLIMRALQRAKNKVCLDTKIVVARALLTSLTFSLSWLPFFVIFRILDKGSFINYTLIMVFSPVNTVTDPCLYIVPNDLIKTALRKIRVLDLHSFVGNTGTDNRPTRQLSNSTNQ